MDLFDLLKGQMGEAAIGALTSQLGGRATQQETSSGMDGAISILTNALAKNAKSADGASALASALDRDHDGGILDDVVGFINGNSAAATSRAGNGAGILGHILGAQQGNAIESLAKASGLSSSQSSSMLAKMAPLVLGMLGKQKKSAGIDIGDLAGLLSGAAGNANKQTSGLGGGIGGLLTSFLDQDGDGSIVDDAAKIGGGFLKNLFKR